MGSRGLPSYMGRNATSPKQEKGLQSTLKSIVDKRKNAKVEFGYTIDLDGNVIKMNRGGRGSCKITDCWDRVGVHNHPAGERGEIGGTFSPADLCSMIVTNRPINYAFDQEHIYELRAINWSPKGVNNYSLLSKGLGIKAEYAKVVSKASSEAYAKANELRQQGKFIGADGFTDYRAYSQWQSREWHRILSQWLKSNARRFGYEYRVHDI